MPTMHCLANSLNCSVVIVSVQAQPSRKLTKAVQITLYILAFKYFLVYLWILVEYLQYLLPIEEQRLSLLKNSNWLTGPLSSLPTSAVTSPRRLLRPEVLAQSAQLEHVSLRSGAFKTLYPRMLQFVLTFLNHLTSLSSPFASVFI